MSNIDKRPYHADGGDISSGCLKEIADNPYGDEKKCWMAKRMLALLDELEAAEKRSREMAELLINLKKARPGGVYFNKWDTQIDSVLHAAAAGKGE